MGIITNIFLILLNMHPVLWSSFDDFFVGSGEELHDTYGVKNSMTAHLRMEVGQNFFVLVFFMMLENLIIALRIFIANAIPDQSEKEINMNKRKYWINKELDDQMDDDEDIYAKQD